MKKLSVIASAVILGMVSYLNAAAHEMFPQESARGGMALAPQAATGSDVLRSRVVPLVQTRTLLAVTDQAAYPFFADAAYTTTVTRVSHGFGNAEIVEGETAGTAIRSVTVYTPEGVRHEIRDTRSGRVYLAASLPDGTMQMQEIDPSLTPFHCESCSSDQFRTGTHLAGMDPLGEMGERTPTNITACSAGTTEIDLMMVFDTEAATWAQNNAGGVSALANSAVTRMNTTLADSNIDCVIRLVGVYLPNYTSFNSDQFKVLQDLTDGRNGLEGVAAQRTACAADIVTLMNDGNGGWAWIGSSDGSAFSVCGVQSVGSGDTMTHEIGHNFGCGHSKGSDYILGPGNTPYAAGLRFVGTNNVPYHTIMAYSWGYYDNGTYIGSSQPCSLFSSPELTWQGVPAGYTNDTDNARRIREHMGTIAAFRAPADVTVTFDAQSGTVSPSTHTYIPGMAYGYLPFPFRVGHMFDGWYTNTSGNGIIITTNSIVSPSVTNLYAKWLTGWNDDFTNAVTLNGSTGSATGANVGATWETGEPNHGTAGHSVWWAWAAPTSGPYRFDTSGSSFDTVLVAYTGSSVASLTEIAENDDSGGGVTSALEFHTVAGTVYYFMVDGKSSPGAIALNWTAAALEIDSPGDYFSSEGLTRTISVTASGAWSVSKPVEATWVSYAAASGNEGMLFPFTVEPNTTGVFRSTLLTFTCTNGIATRTYEILQNSLPWTTSEANALSTATATGKNVLLLAGRFSCPNTRDMRTVVCEDAEIRKALKAGYVLWYCDVDESAEHEAYASGLGDFTTPLICIIDPTAPSAYQDRTTGTQTASVFLARMISGAALATVTLDTQDDRLFFSSQYAKLGSTYGDLYTPTRMGYLFNGWHTTASVGGSPVSAQTTVTNPSDHTLYARWIPTGAALVVTFDAQGGNVSPASRTVYTGSSYDALPIPTWAGHLFAGWYTAANVGGDRIISSTLISTAEAHTLYAKWLSIPLTATVYYVDAFRADDSGTGVTPATAKKTIQAAIDIAAAGDAILVLDGIYAPISTTDKNIIIQSMNGAERTIIDGNHQQRCATLGTNNFSGIIFTDATLTGFTLRNGRHAAINEGGGGTLCGTINECIFTNNYAFFGGGAYYGVLNRCKFIDNEASYGGGSSRSTARNSLYLRNHATLYGGGAYIGEICNCTVKNNTAADRDTKAVGGIWFGTISNCIIWGNTAAGVEHNYMNSSFISYTCTYPLPASGDGNIDTDPMFADDEGRLMPISPCKNTGDNASSFGGLDLDGSARIQGTTVDMGAYERLPSVATFTTPVPVLYSWLDDYYAVSNDAEYEAIAINLGTNRIPVWQSYVACLNPTSLTSRFTAGINFTNGVPEITCDPYRPDIRDYEVEGRATLDNASSWGATNSDSRFFKVKVLLR